MKIADISLPGGYTIKNPVITGSDKPISGENLGALISGILNIVFYLSGFILLGFLLWGAFEYLISQGNKEKLAKAKSKITWALVGFIIIVLAFAISTYIQTELCKPDGCPIKSGITTVGGT